MFGPLAINVPYLTFVPASCFFFPATARMSRHLPLSLPSLPLGISIKGTSTALPPDSLSLSISSFLILDHCLNVLLAKVSKAVHLTALLKDVLIECAIVTRGTFVDLFLRHSLMAKHPQAVATLSRWYEHNISCSPSSFG